MSVSRSSRPGGAEPRVGVWLIGARGSVATTVVVGCAAMTAGLHAPSGMVTETGATTARPTARPNGSAS